MIEWFAANNPKSRKNKCNEICNKEFATLCIDHWL
jgi:hypothetical protein